MSCIRRINFAVAMLVILGFAAAPVARADSFTFTGTFSQDDEIRLFGFTVVGTSASQVTIRTTSYAQGGFDPYLALFQVTPPIPINGLLLDAPGVGPIPSDFFDGPTLFSSLIIGENDDISATNLDAFLQLSLDPGFYVFSVTQSGPFANGNFPVGPSLDDGFTQQGNGNFRGGFIDAFGNRRSGLFIVTVDGPNVTGAAPIPEPATMLLLSTGLAGVAARVRRSRRNRKNETV